MEHLLVSEADLPRSGRKVALAHAATAFVIVSSASHFKACGDIKISLVFNTDLTVLYYGVNHLGFVDVNVVPHPPTAAAWQLRCRLLTTPIQRHTSHR